MPLSTWIGVMQLLCMDACVETDGVFLRADGCVCTCADDIGEFITGVLECEDFVDMPCIGNDDKPL